MDGWMDGRLAGQMDGRMDGQMDGRGLSSGPGPHPAVSFYLTGAASASELASRCFSSTRRLFPAFISAAFNCFASEIN